MYSSGAVTVILLILGVLWLAAILCHLVLLRILFTKDLLFKLRLPYASNRPPMVTILLTQLTAANLLSLLLSVPFLAVNNFHSQNWIFGVLLCKLSPFIGSLTNILDFFSLLGLLLLVHDVAVKSHRPTTSAGKFAFLLTVTWILAIISSLPMLIFLTVEQSEYASLSDDDIDSHWQDLEILEPVGGKNSSSFYIPTTTTSSPKVHRQVVHFCLVPVEYMDIVLNEAYEFWNLLQHLLPLLTLVILSLKTFFSSGNPLSSSNQTVAIANPVSDRERSFAFAISWASLVTALLWTPLILMHFLFYFFNFFFYHYGFLFWHLAMLASQLAVLVKPAVYFAADPHFRGLFKEVLDGFFGSSKKLEPLSIIGVGGDDDKADE